MKEVRLGIIGVGLMGSTHARYMHKISRVKLTALCDIDKTKADALAAEVNCKAWYDSEKLIRSGDVDAVLIATPHYFHTTIGIDALKAGLHVLCEKPISVHKADCERLIAAHTNPKQVFAAMFMQRTDPHYKRMKAVIDSGELGAITRVSWIITDWFRSQAYYSSGGWRATWGGEGGGVLLNQCPHNLDLFQMICGMPKKVYGFCSFGKKHDIEVEDEVTAYFEYPNGATGLFVTTTGEAPGSNRFEICGEMGKLVLERGNLTFTKNEIGQAQFCRTTKTFFSPPEVRNIEFPISGNGGQHPEITQNFVDAIIDNTPLIAPAEEGIRSVELANSILYSSLVGKPVDLPLDGIAYEKELKKLIAESRFVKKTVAGKSEDFSKSFK
jgi:predicted dehydrogenase